MWGENSHWLLGAWAVWGVQIYVAFKYGEEIVDFLEVIICHL